MSEITKWKIYCVTEGKYITGYKETMCGYPLTCFNDTEHVIDKNKSVMLEKINKNHSAKIIKWKIYCDTEKAYTSGYLDGNTPVHCFNNKNHIISKRPVIEDIIINNNVRLVEETPHTGGNIKFKTFQFTVTGNDIYPDPHIGSKTYFESTLPNNISLLSVLLMPNDKNIGDVIEADIGHHTTIGTITEDVSSGITGGITGFAVSQTVMENIQLGYHITLTNGTHTDELKECIMVDRVLNRIATEDATEHSFLASTPTYVQQTIKYINSFHIVNTQNVSLGADKLGTSYIPKSMPGRITYTNNDGKAKKFTFMITYLV